MNLNNKSQRKEKGDMNPIIRFVVKRLSAITWTVAVLAAVTTMAVGKKTETAESESEKTSKVQLTVDQKPVDRTAKNANSYAPIVKKVAPSVVRIDTTARVKQTGFEGAPGMSDPFFRRFFGEGSGNPQMERAPKMRGAGSGVIVTEDGYILTNNHVVENADEVKVSLQDGREFNAKVVGTDPKTDVAVVKVNAKGLPCMELADSEKIEVGDIVLAIGNPFGIGQTVTMGMISAMGRGNIGLDYEDFIQTDAAVNPGNSGGALVDAEGRLIGINTAILSRNGGFQGIGFAIPTNLAKNVMVSLVKDGRVTRGYLGVLIQDLTPGLAKQFDLKDRNGALVGDVTPNSPASKAGLKNGDVVVEYDGKAVKDSRHLKLQVAQSKPGQTVPVTVLRDGSTKTLEVSVKELPGSNTLAKNGSKAENDEGTLNGVTVGDLEPAVRRQIGVPANLHGALVTDVEPDSPAGEAGLRPGDVILEINKKPVRDAEEAVKLTEKTEDKTTLLRVWSNGNSRFVVVDESKAG
jgi:serine protease Do